MIELSLFVLCSTTSASNKHLFWECPNVQPTSWILILPETQSELRRTYCWYKRKNRCPLEQMEGLYNIINILLTGVHHPRIAILLFQAVMVKCVNKLWSIAWLRSIIVFFLYTTFHICILNNRFLCYILYTCMIPLLWNLCYCLTFLYWYYNWSRMHVLCL